MHYLKKIFNKLIENKMFYYVMIALTILHIFLYLFKKAYNAIGVLLLSSIIVYNFNKKPVIVLLSSLIITHIFVANKRTKTLYPVAYGEMGYQDLKERLAVISEKITIYERGLQR